MVSLFFLQLSLIHWFLFFVELKRKKAWLVCWGSAAHNPLLLQKQPNPTKQKKKTSAAAIMKVTKSMNLLDWKENKWNWLSSRLAGQRQRQRNQQWNQFTFLFKRKVDWLNWLISFGEGRLLSSFHSIHFQLNWRKGRESSRGSPLLNKSTKQN